jgi:hypothetical protein
VAAVVEQVPVAEAVDLVRRVAAVERSCLVEPDSASSKRKI